MPQGNKGQGGKGQGNKGQGNKGQGGKNQPPKKQAAKKQAAKNNAPSPQSPSIPAPKNQGNKGQGNKNQGNKNQGNKNQGGKKQGGKKQTTAPATGSGQASTSAVDASKDYLNTFVTKTLNLPGDIDLTTIPDSSSLLDLAISQQQQGFIREINNSNQAQELNLANAENKTTLGVAGLNLQGVQAQADATKFASSQQAEATKFSSVQAAEAQKFSATEQARGSIETERVRSESLERQIGLQGEETRKTDLQSELFRRFKEAKDQLDALKAFKA